MARSTISTSPLCWNGTHQTCMASGKNGTDNSSWSYGDCIPLQVIVPDLIDQLHVRIILGACYALIWLLGVGGNSLVLYLVLWKRLDFSVRTVFIVGLSFSDLSMAMTSLPVTAISSFTRVWILPDFLCYSIGFLQASSIFVSSFTLILIAIDRFYLICYPHMVKFTYQKAILAVSVFWAIGMILAIPMSIFMKMKNLKEEADEAIGETPVCGYGCVEAWPEAMHPAGKRVYGSTVFIIQYGFPMILCSWFYVKISHRIGEQFERRKQTQIVTAETEERSLQRRRRTNRMMVSMVSTFVISWLPLNVVNLLRDFECFEYFVPIKYFTIVFAVGHLIAMTSIIWNPLIYSFFNQQFRTSVKQILARRADTKRCGEELKPNGTTWL